MTRDEKVLCCVNKKGIGLEIGPSFKPVAARAKGYNVKIMDVFTTDYLIKLNKERGFDTSKIEDVDYILDGRSFIEIIGDHECFDWIIASHVIEHTVDFISFINECSKLLKTNGVLSLVIPDKRYCFDYFRPCTGISQIIDAYIQKKKKHSPGSIVEYFLNCTYKNGILAWDKEYRGSYSFPYNYKIVKNMFSKSLNNSEYIDIHNWCFTPSSFRLMLVDLYNLNFILMKEKQFFDTCGHEFFVSLSRDETIRTLEREYLLNILKNEINGVIA